MYKFLENGLDSDIEIKTDNQYVQTYDVWRNMDELDKLKMKYGDELDNDSSSDSSSDDEEGVELTNESERDFFKILACLKNKDPRIYDENITFFQDKDRNNISEERKKKETPMHLKYYEGKVILEKGGVLSDEEDSVENKSKSTTYEEEKHAKKIKNASNANDDDSDEEMELLVKDWKKAREEKEEKDTDYKKWLAGANEHVDEDVQNELKPLKEYWNNPNLDEGEKFLRDYILNKKFLDKDDEDYIPTYHDSDQDLSKDESAIKEQEEFEHKYNFRFEEPDQEFIKRYPRTLENSLRKKDDKRKLKRQETKDRKKKEKEEKMMELKKLQELKRKEIEEKLEKLKEITGNSDIAFENQDIDGDFDPVAHDNRMQALFNDEFYEGPEEDQKPVFPGVDEELEIENWEKYDIENETDSQNIPHCEDDNFNMDCDYDPASITQNELIDNSKKKKKRKRKSKVAEALSKPKPKYDPNDKNYEKYFDEYYKLDCEDIIGDIPCRFKYRSVVPNDFGLSIEEILLAKEQELNKWCSLKKTFLIRPDHVEKYDQIAFKKKAQNVNLKRKILPSLFTSDSIEEDNKDVEKPNKSIAIEEGNEKGSLEQYNETSTSNIKQNKVKTKKKKEKNNDIKEENTEKTETQISQIGPEKVKGRKIKKVLKNNKLSHSVKNKKHKRKRSNSLSANEEEIPKKKMKKHLNKDKKELVISDSRLSAYGINPKKFKNKLKYGKK